MDYLKLIASFFIYFFVFYFIFVSSAPEEIGQIYSFIFSKIFGFDQEKNSLYIPEEKILVKFVNECYGLVSFSIILALLHTENIKKKYIAILGLIFLPICLILNFFRILFMFLIHFAFGINLELLHVLGWFVVPVILFLFWTVFREFLIDNYGFIFETNQQIS